MARINVDSKFFGDGRIKKLASLSSDSIHATRGRLLAVWYECYNQKSPCMSAEDIDIQADWDCKANAEHMLSHSQANAEHMPSKCLGYGQLMCSARLAVEIEDGLYEIKGVKTRVDYLLSQSEKGKKGAKTRYASTDNNKDGLAYAKQMLSKGVSLPPSPSPSPSPDINNNYKGRGSDEPDPDTVFSKISEFDQDLSERWVSWARESTPSMRANILKCTQTIRLLREKDGLTEKTIEDMLSFIRDDPFWSVNALSPASLRLAGKNGLRKFENILAKMRSNGKEAERKVKESLPPGYVEPIRI